MPFLCGNGISFRKLCHVAIGVGIRNKRIVAKAILALWPFCDLFGTLAHQNFFAMCRQWQLQSNRAERIDCPFANFCKLGIIGGGGGLWCSAWVHPKARLRHRQTILNRLQWSASRCVPTNALLKGIGFRCVPCFRWIGDIWIRLKDAGDIRTFKYGASSLCELFEARIRVRA